MESVKLLALLVMMNIVIGMVFAIANSEDTTQKISGEEEALSEHVSDLKTNETLLSGGGTGYSEGSSGSATKMSGNFLVLFLKGLIPWTGVKPSRFHTEIERNIASFIIFFRTFITLLTGYTAYLVFKNKKQD